MLSIRTKSTKHIVFFPVVALLLLSHVNTAVTVQKVFGRFHIQLPCFCNQPHIVTQTVSGWSDCLTITHFTWHLPFILVKIICFNPLYIVIALIIEGLFLKPETTDITLYNNKQKKSNDKAVSTVLKGALKGQSSCVLGRFSFALERILN